MFLALPAGAAPGRRCSRARRLGKLNAPPRTDRPPAVRASRRVTPSQNRRGLPSIRSMGLSLVWWISPVLADEVILPGSLWEPQELGGSASRGPDTARALFW